MNCNLTKIFTILTLTIAAASAYAQATIDSLNQNADQSQGMYQPMNMGYTGISSLGMMQSAWLDPLQNLGEGQSKPAYSRYYWSPDLVLPIRLREGMITLLNFPSWELIEDVYIGDSKTFDGRISGANTLLLYPKQSAMVGVDTNIIVFGRSGNKYVFYARSEGINTERLTNSIIDIEVIDAPKNGETAGGLGNGSSGGRMNASSFRGDSKSVDSTFTKRNQKDDWIQSIPLDPTQFKFDIEVYVPNPDDVVIAPERVWRDDIFTYIDLGERALNMTQRPIVTLIVERVETPVGFRAKGPNNRLIVVEGVGDMVLRNGKRIVCLKLRRSDDAGLENVSYAETNDWDIPPALPNRGNPSEVDGKVQGFDLLENKDQASDATGMRRDAKPYITASRGGNGQPGAYAGGRQSANSSAASRPSEALTGEYDVKVGSNGELVVPQYTQGAPDGIDYSKMHKLGRFGGDESALNDMMSGYKYGSGFEGGDNTSISVELGTDADVNNLENLWSRLSQKYSSTLNSYQPFYSVDAPADGQGRELFHLRIGPVQSIDVGDEICSELGRNGVFCSVVRVQ